MNGSNGRRAGRVAVAFGLLAVIVLAGCGGDGAGSSSPVAATQTAPSAGGGSGATAPTLAVSGAVPATGNGTVALGTGVTTTSTGSTFRQVTIDGIAQGTGYVHRLTVDFDGITGTVAAVTHRWGVSTASFEAITQCARTAGAAVIACGNAVSVDVVTGRVAYTNLVLRGSGTFTSILNGQFTLTTP
jgi:hypothetical protein